MPAAYGVWTTAFLPELSLEILLYTDAEVGLK